MIECPCFCHEELGGGVHPGERCRCNGGAGMSDPYFTPAAPALTRSAAHTKERRP